MYKKPGGAHFTAIAAWCVLTFGLWGMPAQANPAGGGQIPAFLPFMSDVPMTEKMPIDGEWMVDTIRKRIRIEGGRAYAVDSWLHLFVLKVEPMMVVIQDIKRARTGQYTAYDLPLMGAWSAQLLPSGSLKVTVAGALGPASYNLVPVKMDDQQSFALEKSGQSSPGMPDQRPGHPTQQPTYPPQQPAVEPEPQPESDLANCQSLDVDSATGDVVCMD